MAKDTGSQISNQENNGPDPMALQAEVQKWQERVPKLASALRERSEALEAAKEEIRRLQSQSGDNNSNPETIDARLSTRDELIEELEQKLLEADNQRREIASQIHARDLEIEAQTSQASHWKEKWQRVTRSLDEAVADKNAQAQSYAETENRWQESEQDLLQQHQDMQDELLQEIKHLNEHIEKIDQDANNYLAERDDQLARVERLQSECESLGDRNKNLHASAELANNQMESMGEEVGVLNQQIEGLSEDLLQARNAQLESEEALQDALLEQAKIQNVVDDQRVQTEAISSAHARYAQDTSALVADQEATIVSLREEMVDVVSRLTQETSAAVIERDQATAAIAKLEQTVAQHDDVVTSIRVELERTKEQLNERSQFVRQLEAEMDSNKQEQQEKLKRFGELESATVALETELAEANNRSATHQEHAQNLEQKLQQQMQLLNQLEDELSQSTKDAGQEVRVLEERVRQLQEKLVAACEQRDELQDELQNLRDAPSNSLEVPDSDEMEALQHDIAALHRVLKERTEELQDLRWRYEQKDVAESENVVMILNQQLRDARSENERLLLRLGQSQVEFDDLTEIRGVGSKLARQLHQLGYTSYAQIAQLSANGLEEAEHPLYSMRARIVRDEWIDQAKSLSNDDPVGLNSI